MTHVNAYAADAMEARDAVVRALSNFHEAAKRLEEHPDFRPDMKMRLPFEVLRPEDKKSDPKAKEVNEAKV